MKTSFWIVLFIVVVLIIVGFIYYNRTNKVDLSLVSRKINTFQPNQISCPVGCTLSLNTSGSSGTATQGNNTYTCRCSDGSTTTPILN